MSKTRSDAELDRLMVRMRWATRACLIFAVLNIATIAWALAR